MNHYGFRVQGRPPGHYPEFPGDMSHDDFEVRSVAVEHAQRLEGLGWTSIGVFSVRDRVRQGPWDEGSLTELIPIEWQLHVVGA